MKIFTAIRQCIPVCAAAIIICLSLTFLTDKAVTTVSEALPLDGRRCVIIDAGHGGVDGGAVSCTGIKESQLNLVFAQKLRDIFHLLGIKTLMLRNTDADLSRVGGTIAARKISDLKERVRIINESEDSLLVSLHQNYFPDSRYSGPQVFYNGLENSKDIAGEVQQGIHTHLSKTNKRSIKKCSGVYIMEHIQRPGILIECGFLSNPAEEALVRQSDYQKKFCCTVAVILSRCLNT